MKPINFKQSTKVLQKPGTLSDSECGTLPVWCDGKQCVSCWKPSIKERINILFGGKVWLGVMSGKTQPPVFVAGERVFQKTPFLTHLRAFFISVGEVIAKACRSRQNARQAQALQSWNGNRFDCGRYFRVLRWFGMGRVDWIHRRMYCRSNQEWWDSKGHGTVELMDFVFTAMGAASGACVSVPVMMLLRLFIQL